MPSFIHNTVSAVGTLLAVGLIALCAACKDTHLYRRRGPDGLTYIRIDAGRFLMGSPFDARFTVQLPYAAEVQLSKGFSMSETEVSGQKRLSLEIFCLVVNAI